MDRARLDGSQPQSTQDVGQMDPVETVVHDPGRVVPMEGTILGVEIGEGHDAPRFQAMHDFVENEVDIVDVMEGHRREDQVELLREILRMEIEQQRPDIGDPLCGNLVAQCGEHLPARVQGQASGHPFQRFVVALVDTVDELLCSFRAEPGRQSFNVPRLGQLDYALRKDPRVAVMEKTNVRAPRILSFMSSSTS